MLNNKEDIKRCFEKINTLNDKVNNMLMLEQDQNRKIYQRIEAVEILFNNINEINYLNNKGSK